MSRIYSNKKYGIVIHLGDCNLPELKEKGVILRKNSDSEIFAITNTIFKEHFTLKDIGNEVQRSRIIEDMG